MNMGTDTQPGGLAPASDRDLRRVWRTVRDTGLFVDERALRTAARRPFRVLVGGSRFSPRLVVARPWRVGSDVLAVQFMAAVPADRMDTIAAIARAAAGAGFARVLSPMVSDADATPFVMSGFELREQVYVMALEDLGPDEGRRTGLLGRNRGASGPPPAPPAPEEGVTIRTALTADIDQILDLDAESFDDFWGYGRGDLEELLPVSLAHVAERSDEVVGYTVGNVSGRQGNLVRLAVARGSRRQGIASALVANVAREMRRRGARKLLLCTQTDNEASQRLYAGLGLSKVGPALGLYVRPSEGPTAAQARP